MTATLIDLFRLEYHGYFNCTMNKIGMKMRSLVVKGDPASNTSTIEVICHRDSLINFENWFNANQKLISADLAAATLASSVQMPVFGQVYTMQGVMPVSVDIERCIILLSSTSYH